MIIENSFGLIRTNPALTSNVKIVITGEYKLYLESFQINKGLSQDRYKHFEVKSTDYYNESLYHFYQNGISLDQAYDTPGREDEDEMYDDFHNQYDDTYLSGATWAEDTWYKEEFEYFAPLYVDQKRPKYFVILRVDGPGLKVGDPTNFRTDLVEQWKFINMFDLTEATDLGRWLKLNMDDPDFPKNSLVIKHEPGQYSELSGINIETGGWVTKTLDLSDEQRVNTPIFKTEEFITQNYQTNNVVYPNILNLKFLFDDTPATPEALRKYSINRYMGFYLDEMEQVKTITPHQPFELNKVPDNLIETLSEDECDEIPYLQDNIFVRDIKGRSYSFDPIKNGWDDKKVYWIEYQENFYRVEKVINTSKTIVGDFLYKVISNITIERKIDQSIQNLINTGATVSSDVLKQQKKVIINDLSTMKGRVEILPKLEFPNFQATNIIRNVNPNFVTYKRNFQSILVDGVTQYVFTLSLSNEINNNLFGIDNFASADLFLVEVAGKYYVLKRYPTNTPNVGGSYYLQSDWAVEANQKSIKSWINNGNLTKDATFYSETSVEQSIGLNQPITFKVYRVKFTDIKDFDFDRVETKYSDFEYEIEDNFTETMEPKFYAKEHRKLTVDVKKFPKEYVQLKPILDLNNEVYDPLLYQTDFNGDPIYTDDTKYNSFKVTLPREYYREENYKYLVDGDTTKVIDFTVNSEPVEFVEEAVFGTNGYTLDQIKLLPIVDIWPEQDTWQNLVGKKKMLNTNGKSLPDFKAKRDPNLNYDRNYVPVSSEYIASDELFEVRGISLSPIWSKTPTVCKWGLFNSNNTGENSYRLNYDLDIGGLDNRSPHIFSNLQYPLRSARDLDFFYRFGLVNRNRYKNYTLHLKDTFFDNDKYFSTGYDYFEAILKSDHITSDGIKLNQKYSVFHSGSEFMDPYTVFKGIRYNIGDVTSIQSEQFVDTTTNTTQTYIEDIFTDTSGKYNGYRFAIVMGRKLSIFNNNPGRNNGNFGIDVYLNDKWKNVLINIYFETDETLQIDDPAVTTTRYINAETCVIDKWYQDKDIARTDLNSLIWDKMEFKINGQNIGVRPRDLRLVEVLTILNNYNYRPDLSVEGETRNPVNYIHIYADGTSKIMTCENTDFIVKTELPSEFLTKESGFLKTPIKVSLDINNTFKNTIVLDDDTNNPLNDPTKTIDGVLVGAVPDLNAYNDYPFAFEITDANLDIRASYELEEGRDPEIHRYEGVYTPLFKNVDLFRPLNYIGINHNNPLGAGNYKFYDPRSSGVLSTTTLRTFGFVSELIFSKVNRSGSILKLNDPNSKYRSIFPMVDECGYSYIPKYMFQSNWDLEFYLESKKRVLPKNEYPGQAGYAVYFSAQNDKIVVPDQDKFNYYIDGFQDGNIDVFDETQMYSGWQSGSAAGTQNVVFDQDASNGLSRKGTDINRNTPVHFIYGPYLDIKSGRYTVTFRIKLELNEANYTNESANLFTIDIVDSYSLTTLAIDTITGAEVPEFGVYNDYTLTFDAVTVISKAEFRILVNYAGGLGHAIYFDYVSVQREDVIVPSQLITGAPVSASGFTIPSNKSLIPGMYYRFKYTGTSLNFLTGTNVYKNGALQLVGSTVAVSSVPSTTFKSILTYLPISYHPTLALGNFARYTGGGTVTQVEIEEATPYVDLEFKEFGTSGYSFCFEMKVDSAEKYARVQVNNVTSVSDLSTRINAVLSPLSAIPANVTVKNRESLYITTTQLYTTTVVDTNVSRAKLKIHLLNQLTPSTAYNFKIRPKKTSTKQSDYNYVYRDFQTGTSNSYNPRVKLRGYFTKPVSFSVNPANYSEIPVNAETRYSTNNNVIPVADIISQINDDLKNQPFTATLTLATTTYFEFYITADNNGSYNNFSIIPTTVKSYVKKVKLMGKPETILKFRTLKPIRNGHFVNIRYDYLRPVRNGIFKPVIIKPKQVVLFTQPIVIPKIGFAGSKAINALIKKQNDALAAQQAAINALKFSTQNNEVARQEKSVAIISSEMDTTIVNEVVTGRHINLKKSKVGYTGSFTIEFWVFVNGWVNQNETILYKGLDGVDPWAQSTLYDVPNFSWAIGRDGSNNRLAFRTCHIKPALLKKIVLFKANQPYFAGQIILFNNNFYEVISNIDPSATFAAIPQIKISQKNYIDVVDIHTLTTEKEINDENWHHVAFTFDADLCQKTIYIDGRIDRQYKDDEPLLNNIRSSMTGSVNNADLDTWDILIGTDSVVNNGRRNFLGSIDEVRVWNYSRSRNQIYNNHRLSLNKTSYLDPEKSLIFYLRLDEGKGVNTFSDLMSFDSTVQRGWLIDDIDRYQITSMLTENDGKSENITNDVSVRQFVSSYDLPEGTTSVPSSREILVTDSETEWVVSGADIQGLSDERYPGVVPPAVTTRKSIDIPKIIVPKSKFVLKEPPKPAPAQVIIVRPHIIQTFAIFNRHIRFSIQKPIIIPVSVTPNPPVDDNPYRIFGLINTNKPIESWYKKREQEVKVINTKTVAGIKAVAKSIFNPFKK